MKLKLILLVAMFFAGCGVDIPDGATAVTNFQLDRYLGRWYEIARLDNRFERGLTKVTADYSLRSDGTVRVQNRGWNAAEGKWQTIEGKAQFVDRRDVGRLKVSFFGPFYAGYNVIALDPNYQWSLVVGSDFDYLWILSRTPTLDSAIVAQLVEQARDLGFAVEDLRYVQ